MYTKHCRKSIHCKLLFIVLDFQITFQVKRMRKPKSEADVSESWAGEEDSSQSDSSAANSILEISGPTIPSPGPSGSFHMNRLLSFSCSIMYTFF